MGRDLQMGNNVLLSGNIGKGVVTGKTSSWRSLEIRLLLYNIGWCRGPLVK